jgi:hypothetical protein
VERAGAPHVVCSMGWAGERQEFLQ